MQFVGCFLCVILMCSSILATDSDDELLLQKLESNSRRSQRRSSTVRSATDPPDSSALDPDAVGWLEHDGVSVRRRQSASSDAPSPPTPQAPPAPPPPPVSENKKSTSRRSQPRPSSVSRSGPAHQRRSEKSRARLSPSQRLVAASPVCPSRTEWKQLYTARDINNTAVEVYQPDLLGTGVAQWFYTVSCRNQAFRWRRSCEDCCIGIDSSRYASSCEQKQSYVMAYVRRPWQTKFHYNWILINSSCNCAITSLHDDL